MCVCMLPVCFVFLSFFHTDVRTFLSPTHTHTHTHTLIYIHDLWYAHKCVLVVVCVLLLWCHCDVMSCYPFLLITIRKTCTHTNVYLYFCAFSYCDVMSCCNRHDIVMSYLATHCNIFVLFLIVMSRYDWQHSVAVCCKTDMTCDVVCVLLYRTWHCDVISCYATLWCRVLMYAHGHELAVRTPKVRITLIRVYI